MEIAILQASCVRKASPLDWRHPDGSLPAVATAGVILRRHHIQNEGDATMVQSAPSNDAISKMLQALSTNQAAREQMLGDPITALKSYGIDADPANVPAVRALPSMQEVAQLHKEFVADPLILKSCIFVFIVLGKK
jgi:putative modified peptide